MSTNQIVSKVWSFCISLRDDGVGYGDYLEQLTYLLFLKMAEPRSFKCSAGHLNGKEKPGPPKKSGQVVSGKIKPFPNLIFVLAVVSSGSFAGKQGPRSIY